MSKWSFSSLKTFEQCPKKYYHIKVACDVEDSGGTAAIYGTLLHTAAEEYVRDGVPLPSKFAYAKPALDSLKSIPGEKHCEIKLGIREEAGVFTACAFDDPDYWWHGIADLVILDKDMAFSVDYKSSKNAKYADIRQLDILAWALFLHYPHIHTVKSALAFLVSKDFLTKTHHRDDIDAYHAIFSPTLYRLDGAFTSGTWNTNTGPLCGYCPVHSCTHNKT